MALFLTNIPNYVPLSLLAELILPYVLSDIIPTFDAHCSEQVVFPFNIWIVLQPGLL